MSSCLPTTSPARSTKAVRMSNARLLSRAGVSPSSRSLCSTNSRNGPTEIAGPSVGLHTAFPDFTQFYLTLGSRQQTRLRAYQRKEAGGSPPLSMLPMSVSLRDALRGEPIEILRRRARAGAAGWGARILAVKNSRKRYEVRGQTRDKRGGVTSGDRRELNHF
jgi:hypothetical protein